MSDVKDTQCEQLRREEVKRAVAAETASEDVYNTPSQSFRFGYD